MGRDGNFGFGPPPTGKGVRSDGREVHGENGRGARETGVRERGTEREGQREKKPTSHASK